MVIFGLNYSTSQRITCWSQSSSATKVLLHVYSQDSVNYKTLNICPQMFGSRWLLKMFLKCELEALFGVHKQEKIVQGELSYRCISQLREPQSSRTTLVYPKRILSCHPTWVVNFTGWHFDKTFGTSYYDMFCPYIQFTKIWQTKVKEMVN